MPKQKPEILKVFYNGEELIIYSYHCAYKSMNSFLHYIHRHFTDPKIVPRHLNMKQVTNIHKMTNTGFKKRKQYV